MQVLTVVLFYVVKVILVGFEIINRLFYAILILHYYNYTFILSKCDDDDDDDDGGGGADQLLYTKHHGETIL